MDIKLSGRLKNTILEALNPKTMTTLKFTSPTTDSDFVYFINVQKRTKYIVFFNRDERIRILELDLKDDASQMGKLIFQGTSENVIKNFERLYAAFIERLAASLGYKVEIVQKKLGTGKIKKDSGWIDLKGFVDWCVKQGIQFINITHYFSHLTGKVKLDVLAGQKFGNYELINYEDKFKDIKDILSKADVALKKAGFEDLGYGKVFLVSKADRANQGIADYSWTDDTTRMFTGGIKGNLLQQPVRAFIHEMGHRYYYKKLKPEAWNLISKRYYEEISKKDRKSAYDTKNMKIGTRIDIPKHGELEYLGVKAIPNTRGKVGIIFAEVKDGKVTNGWLPFKSYSEADIYLTQLEATKEDSIKVINPWLPTTYSTSSPTEWFSEVFSFAVVNNDKEVLDWIKSL